MNRGDEKSLFREWLEGPGEDSRQAFRQIVSAFFVERVERGYIGAYGRTREPGQASRIGISLLEHLGRGYGKHIDRLEAQDLQPLVDWAPEGIAEASRRILANKGL